MDDLSAAEILRALHGTRFRRLEVHPSLRSTQLVLTGEAGPDGHVVVADHQTEGRGRQGRAWEAPPGVSLLFSVRLREPAARAGLVALAAGVAVARAVEAAAGVTCRLKWPNDVLLDGRKVCGILGEVAGEAVVLGIGVNVHQTADQLPPGVAATSLAVAGRDAHRGVLLAAVLHQLAPAIASASLLSDYRSLCDTIGRQVRVELGDAVAEGTAESVDDDGALIVDGRRILAGDVVHVR